MVFVGVVLVGLIIAWAVRSGPVETATVGRAAPEFTVSLLTGGSWSLADHLRDDGRPLVLNLWASWCLPCRTEMPDIDEFAAANPDIAVVGVAVDDRLQHAIAFAEEVAVGYPLAFGDRAFELAYPRIGLPVTYFIDSSGVVAGLRNGIVTVATLEELVAAIR
jgi:thiol-disulfide isomerase/thioredoxin